jgi:hypothetical protein
VDVLTFEHDLIPTDGGPPRNSSPGADNGIPADKSFSADLDAVQNGGTLVHSRVPKQPRSPVNVGVARHLYVWPNVSAFVHVSRIGDPTSAVRMAMRGDETVEVFEIFEIFEILRSHALNPSPEWSPGTPNAAAV